MENAISCDDLAPADRKTCIVIEMPDFDGSVPAQIAAAAIIGETSCPISNARVNCDY